MRLGKIEKQILKALTIWQEVNPEWEWYENRGFISKLAYRRNIEAYETGERVPVWMLRRDIACGKTVLSRALRTLQAKGLVILYGADLDTLEGLTRSVKYVGLRSRIFPKTADLKS